MAPLRLSNINHISRVCTNVSASKAFYENVLGFVEVVRPSQLEDSFEGCWLFGYNVGIHIIEGEPLQRSPEINPKDDHMSFQCDSFSDVVEALEQEGIKYVQAQICHEAYVINQVFFHDPDHNMIEICTCECMPVTPLRDLKVSQCAAAKNDMVSIGDLGRIRTPSSSFLDLTTLDLNDETLDPSVTSSPKPLPQPPAIRLTTCA